jgi:NADH-quinone oxidoreductase subunit L
MALALIVLAIGSVLAGYVGVPHALGGSNQLAAWLEPAFEAPAAGGEPIAAAAPEATEETAPAEETEDIALERTLMAVSGLIALAGIGLAVLLWLRRRDIPDALARQFAGLHRLLLNKYYVDEVYDAAVVQPIKLTSQEGLWRVVDMGAVDGAVNGTASLVGNSSSVLRRLQSGSVLTYAGSVIFGVVLILGYYLWR